MARLRPFLAVMSLASGKLVSTIGACRRRSEAEEAIANLQRTNYPDDAVQQSDIMQLDDKHFIVYEGKTYRLTCLIEEVADGDKS